ncbi:hypothetical protein [Streptosporangium sp. KLBMP 9127]|nr:hypothetical protein [Streptosporangium sp. KLBMP 9127]
MSTLDFSLEALNRLRSSVSTRGGNLSGLADDYPHADVASSLFGKLDSSATLATAVNGIEDAIDDELTAAGSKLGGVERALDTVYGNIRSVEDVRI